MQFEPLDQGVGFMVQPGSQLTLGRLPQFKLTHARISRQHVDLTVASQQQQQQGDSSNVVCTCLAHKKAEVKRGTDVHAVQPGQQFQVGWCSTVAVACCCTRVQQNTCKLLAATIVGSNMLHFNACRTVIPYSRLCNANNTCAVYDDLL
jgi:hypothetical protein